MFPLIRKLEQNSEEASLLAIPLMIFIMSAELFLFYKLMKAS
jgi:hypothetical protein